MMEQWNGNEVEDWLIVSRRSIQILYNNITIYATFMFLLFRKPLCYKRINISHDFDGKQLKHPLPNYRQFSEICAMWEGYKLPASSTTIAVVLLTTKAHIPSNSLHQHITISINTLLF
jgi:hypothetical protein